ncbi:glutamate--tRNA ligase [Enterovirga sp.]|jgi:glutamyl-tRNA synthetase|uniref:glutamate--tRNA ligase n=1 Tax=Enterovirga sp. TaxID=2026350 RepID=UPI00263847BD|nr:glutamate--tRNA ligase [Enterovirga sp.]MDB5591510.1 glutamyl-tRNA synthetase [Enterovirga sp.]
MPDPVVTRFAPSPTGFLHIGGARTALFNWLYARHLGGRMLLRIEDTDRERSTEPAIAAILDGLSWLGLDWDGDVVFQFSRAARHREVVEGLLASGGAYRCYASPEELAEMRESARSEGRPARYDGRWRDRDPADAPAGVKPVIRLRAPQEGETAIVDQVQGRVVWQNKDLDDLVLLRSDGTPTYMLAVVVDDHDMGVTHVIRGDDHLTNGARQTQIYQALGWSVPGMAHIPLIHGPDGAKLSKRHGALGIDAYRSMGFLPSALRNYLVRLGWSHGNQEIFTDAEMVAAFDLPQIGRSPARFDAAKLENLNGHHLRETPAEQVLQAIEVILPDVGPARGLGPHLDPELRARLLASLPGLKERAKTLIELLDAAYYLYAPSPLALDAKAAAILDAPARARLAAITPALAALPEWNTASLEAAVRAGAEALGVKLGQLAQPLRAAVTGRGTSPPLFDVMAVLGRDVSMARIGAQARAEGVETTPNAA